MSCKRNPFRTQRNGDQYLDVHVDNIATVVIKREDEGVVIDVYPFKDMKAEPVTSTWVHHHDLSPHEAPPVLLLTPWQRTALTTYALSEFAYLADATNARALKESLRDCGDSLLRFIVSELSAREDCDSFDDAIRRITVARNQLSDLIEDLQAQAATRAETDCSPRFRLVWAMDSDATTPLAAAQEALAIQRRTNSTATVFKVRETATGEVSTIDLADHQPQ
jgi:hypothetical protein